jgi:ERF superfamily
MSNIATALVKARKAFGPALKTKSNPHLKSKYADLSACLEAVEDALTAAGIWLYQETSESGDGVTVETVFLHESGESLRCGKLHVPAVKADPQGYGSALTYARRYSLMTACGIAAEDDDGQAASRAPAKADADLMTRAVLASNGGTAKYAAFWAGLSKDDRAAIGAKAHADFKAKAAENDEVTA